MRHKSFFVLLFLFSLLLFSSTPAHAAPASQAELAGISASLQNILSLLGKLIIPQETAQAQTTGLVGHWKFDEGLGTTANDASGSANTGTLTNGPVWTAGKIGGAVSFDGTNDLVSVTAASSINDLPALTFSLWIKPNLSQNNSILFSKSNFGGAGYFLRS